MSNATIEAVQKSIAGVGQGSDSFSSFPSSEQQEVLNIGMHSQRGRWERGKKYRWMFLLITTLMFPVLVNASSWTDATAKKVREMYPIEKSKNSAASAEFLKAMEYRIYIEELHPTRDYDDPFMLKLIRQMDEHFQKGKKLLPKNSVEDIVWWVLFYKDIYGLTVPSRNDYSLAYENLPYQEFAKKHDEIFQMIERFPYGVVNFDLPEIKGFRFQAMAALVDFYSGRYAHRYSGKTDRDRAFHYVNDPKSKKNLQKLLKYYEVAKNKYLNTSKSVDAMTLQYSADIVFITAELIRIGMYHTQNQQFTSQMCYSNEANLVKIHTPTLIDAMKIDDYQTQVIYKELFDRRYSNNSALMKLLAQKCPNLNPEMENIVKKITQFEKNTSVQKGKK